MKFFHDLKYIFLEFFFFFVDISQAEHDRCDSPDWVAFKDEKCYKVLDINVSFSEAVEACKRLLPFEDLTGCNHPSTVLTIGSSEEQEFLQANNVLSPNYQNPWIALSEAQYTNWATGYPILPPNIANLSTGSRNCVEVELNNLTNHGKWQSLSCQDSRRVVCQNIQTLHPRDLQHELFDAKRELVVQKVEIQEVKGLFNQLLFSQEQITEVGMTLQSTNGLIEQLQENCISTDPIDLKADRTTQLEAEISVLKTKVQSLQSENQELKSPVDKLLLEVVQLRGLITEVKSSLISTKAETDWLNKLSEAIKSTMTDLNRGLETLKSLFKGSQAPIEVIRGDVQMLRSELTAFEGPFKKARADIELVRGSVNKAQGDVISRVGALQGNLNQRVGALQGELNRIKAAAVTNLRFGGPQHVAIWSGPGYNDEFGWVITSVSNSNRDAWPDRASRRRIQKYVNGVWSDI